MFQIEYASRDFQRGWLSSGNRYRTQIEAEHIGADTVFESNRFRVVNVKTGEVVYEQE